MHLIPALSSYASPPATPHVAQTYVPEERAAAVHHLTARTEGANLESADRIAPAPETSYPFAPGTRVPLDLEAPCTEIAFGLRCGAVAGYVDVRPESVMYEQYCASGHFIRSVTSAEVALRLGMSLEEPARTAHPLEPSRRCARAVIVRDEWTCVYCARRANDIDVSGRRIDVAAAHVIGRESIDLGDLRHDRDLRIFARDTQLVTACAACRSSPRAGLADLETATEIFVRHVLRGETRGPNAAQISSFQRLWRLAGRRSRGD